MVYYFDSLKSTNNTLREIAKNNAKNLLTVWTSKQTSGRGYYGNKWLTEPGKNLLFSTLIEFNESYHYLFYLNQWVSNVMHSYLEGTIKNEEISVKWPNDIIVKKKKIAGILIENLIVNKKQYSIIGIGLNVNQTKFNGLPSAISMKQITGVDYNLEFLTSDLLSVFKSNYHYLEERKFHAINQSYQNHLFLKNKICVFEKNGEKFNGIIQKVNQKGQLEVLLEDDSIQCYNHKEIKMLY